LSFYFLLILFFLLSSSFSMPSRAPSPVLGAASSSRPSLKVCILAAGYGTRLERDIRNDEQGRFKELIGVPKPLVPINAMPLITRWVRLLQTHSVDVEDIFVIGNQYNHNMLQTWAKTCQVPATNIVNDGSTSNDTRLGAVADLNLLVSRHLPLERLGGGLLVVGGDTLFYPDFDLGGLLSKVRAEGQRNHILYYNVEDTRKNGILETNDEGLVTAFLEKPLPTETSSRKACPCFYVLTAEALTHLQPFVAAARSLHDVDAPGNLIKHLIALNKEAGSPDNIPIEATQIRGRFDIGGLDTYIQCDQWFREQENA
jgi:NDP-sugar pyrophosphorylase family protein